jgi:hypothetical protein
MAGIAGKSFPEIASRSAPVKNMRKLASDLVQRQDHAAPKTAATALLSKLRKKK